MPRAAAKARPSPLPGDPEEAQRAAILARHREEWGQGRECLLTGIRANLEAASKEQQQLAAELLRNAKLAMETLGVLQAGELKAWGIAPPAPQAANQELAVQFVRILSDLHADSD